MARYRLRPPEFECRQFAFDVTSCKAFTEIFGYPCEKREKDRVLVVDRGEEHPTIVPDGWWMLQDAHYVPARCFIMSHEAFQRNYAPVDPGELFW